MKHFLLYALIGPLIVFFIGKYFYPDVVPVPVTVTVNQSNYGLFLKNTLVSQDRSFIAQPDNIESDLFDPRTTTKFILEIQNQTPKDLIGCKILVWEKENASDTFWESRPPIPDYVFNKSYLKNIQKISKKIDAGELSVDYLENRFLGKISKSQLSELSEFEISGHTGRKLEFYSSTLPALIHSLKLQVMCLNQHSNEVIISKKSIG